MANKNHYCSERGNWLKKKYVEGITILTGIAMGITIYNQSTEKVNKVIDAVSNYTGGGILKKIEEPARKEVKEIKNYLSPYEKAKKRMEIIDAIRESRKKGKLEKTID